MNRIAYFFDLFFMISNEKSRKVLCGNKADLEDKRQVSTERAKQFALEHG